MVLTSLSILSSSIDSSPIEKQTQMSENAVFCVMFFSFTYLTPVHFHFASGLLSSFRLPPPLSSSFSQSVGVQRDRPVMAAEVLADDPSLCCHSLQPNGPDSNRLRWDCGFHWSCWSQSHTEICGIHSNTRQDLCVDLMKCPFTAIKQNPHMQPL